jgi:hypothetical protein
MARVIRTRIERINVAASTDNRKLQYLAWRVTISLPTSGDRLTVDGVTMSGPLVIRVGGHPTDNVYVTGNVTQATNGVFVVVETRDPDSSTDQYLTERV